MRLLPEISLRVRYQLTASASHGTLEIPQPQCHFSAMLYSIPGGLCIVVLVRPKTYTEDWSSHSFQGLYGLSSVSNIDLLGLVSLIEL